MENELKVWWWKWLELLQLTETGLCSACSSMKAQLEAAILGEELVLVTYGEISCFRHSAIG